jgi:OOP family OmpA-OmpF porin
MFEKTGKKSLVAMVAPLGLATGLLLLSTSAMSDGHDKYVVSGASGEVVTSGHDECWLSIGGKAVHCGEAPTPEPEKDSDGDGVVDSRDQCPNTPKGVAVNAFGCPKDSDGDGVADYKDKCPNTAPGQRVDSVGCDYVDTIVINATTDHFDFDSARLKPAMKAALDDIAAKVSASGSVGNLVIVGHTDSIGSAAYNQKLSERRAQSAANYLAGKGLRDLSISGMGENQPVADNRTRAGRAANRRVEIRSR